MLCFGSTDKLGKYQEDPINKKNMTVAHNVTGGLCQQDTGLKAENPKHYTGIKLYHVHMSDYFLE